MAKLTEKTKRRGRPPKAEKEITKKKKKTRKEATSEKTKRRGRPPKAETTTKTKKKRSASSTKAKATTRTRKPLDIKPIKEKFTKTQLNEYLELLSGVPKADVRKVLAAQEKVILGSIMKKGLREFMLPGVLKVVTKSIPARKEKKGINPFTKEPCIFKAKPATIRVKVRPMKKLKDAALM